MKVYYQKCWYTVPFKIGAKILSDELWLISRRILRGAKRYLSYGKNLIVPLIATAISISIIYKIGIAVGKCSTLFDLLWELKAFLLSTFIITYSTVSFSNERNRHRALKDQYSINYSYEFEVSECIRSLCDMISIPLEHRIFLTEDHADVSRAAIRPKLSDVTIPTKNSKTQLLAIRLLLEHLDAAVTSVSSHLLKSALVNSSDTEELLGTLSDVQKFIREEVIKTYSDAPKRVCDIADLSLSIIGIFYHSIAILRRPWRAENDYFRNCRIRALLVEHGQIISGLFDTTLYWVID